MQRQSVSYNFFPEFRVSRVCAYHTGACAYISTGRNSTTGADASGNSCS